MKKLLNKHGVVLSEIQIRDTLEITPFPNNPAITFREDVVDVEMSPRFPTPRIFIAKGAHISLDTITRHWEYQTYCRLDSDEVEII